MSRRLLAVVAVILIVIVLGMVLIVKRSMKVGMRAYDPDAGAPAHHARTAPPR